MIFLSIGSNLVSKYGDRIFNIKKTIELLNTNDIKVISISSYYETPSYPNQSDPKFINIAAAVSFNQSPIDLLNKITLIEKSLGRVRGVKNQPRICDIDIIDFEGNIMNNEKLILPHKNMHNRNFVLLPLKEICPYWKHPLKNIKIDELIDNLSLKTMNEITRIV